MDFNLCGFVGFLNAEERADIVNDMLDIQSYRGPDDMGVYFDSTSGVHFGHNRLSIQDLSSQGHQPFISDCENYIIVFNGEVYNFKLVRAILETAGHRFISGTDTEVILYAYKEWGSKCLEKLIGMFAFCILDKTKNKIFLVRDRAGVKPLYYYAYEDEFMFSSELKSFHKHPKFNKKQNSMVLPYYFQFGYIPAPLTIFQNCYKLEPGHYLEFNILNGDLNIIKYWDVNDFYAQDEIKSDESEILEDIESILDDSVALRMISDVPIGVFLSGGYDSSLVASILAKKLGKKINTFTVGFEDTEHDEAKHAKKIADFLGTNHTEYYMKSNDILNLVEKIPFYYDEPFGDASALPLMMVSNLAKQNVSVALSGDGGDEAFCGYSKYFILNRFKDNLFTNYKRLILRSLLNLININNIEYINKHLPKRLKQTNIKDKYIKLLRAMNSNTTEEMFEKASSHLDKDEIVKFLKVKLDKGLNKKWKMVENIGTLKQMMAIDYKLFMSDSVLTKVDRATMSVSLEGREPLLDHRIIEYMARVPSSIKYKNNQGKYLLRQILYKHIPKNLIDKPKSGFTIPLSELLQNELRPLVEKYLCADKLDGDLFDVEEVINLKNKFYEDKRLGTQIWFIIMYQMWRDEWIH